MECPPGRSLRSEQPSQNWSGQGESDCLIKTKHCDGKRVAGKRFPAGKGSGKRVAGKRFPAGKGSGKRVAGNRFPAGNGSGKRVAGKRFPAGKGSGLGKGFLLERVWEKSGWEKVSLGKGLGKELLRRLGKEWLGKGFPLGKGLGKEWLGKGS